MLRRDSSIRLLAGAFPRRENGEKNPRSRLPTTVGGGSPCSVKREWPLGHSWLAVAGQGWLHFREDGRACRFERLATQKEALHHVDWTRPELKLHNSLDRTHSSHPGHGYRLHSRLQAQLTADLFRSSIARLHRALNDLAPVYVLVSKACWGSNEPNISHVLDTHRSWQKAPLDKHFPFESI